MKRFALLCLMVLLGTCDFGFAQEEEKKEDDNWKQETTTEESDFPYLKEKYEETFKLPFDQVWEAAVKSIDEINCQIINKQSKQDDNGLYKGKIESDYCIFAVGDTVWQNFNYYGVKPPFIRGGIWVSGRFQYKFIIKENEDGSTYLRLIGEVSGFETHVTDRFHFFQSNGFKETMMLERVKKNLGLPYEIKEG